MVTVASKRKPVKAGNDAADDKDFVLCLLYIQAVEVERKTKLQWATEQDINPGTVYQWIYKWTESGLLRKVRQYLGRTLVDDVIVAQRQAAEQWPKLLAKQIELGFNAKSDFVKFQAIGWLFANIVKPLQDEQDEPGSAEKDYLDMITLSPRALNPLSVAGELPEDEPEPEAPASTSEALAEVLG